MHQTEIDKYDFTQGIISSSESLKTLLSDKGGKILRGIEEDSQCAYKLKELERLIGTLKQYSNKSHSLAYIGFLGHYSSGKSSTQNSLLGTWETHHERKTDLNPTDTLITLTTHKDNSGKLVGNDSRGRLVVATEYVDLAILKDKVIIDTPGSGEPGQNKEMVSDFLPICDLLIYIFSATNPLDENDIPILKQAHEELPFIPIKFIITRSNEFSLEHEKPLTKENLDTTKINNFTSVLISRLNQIIPNRNFKQDDFLFIDNKSKFNIDKLNYFVFDNNNEDNLNLYKIKFFLHKIKEVREYFKRYADEQRDFLNKLVNAATSNHEKYKEQFSIGKSTLTESWRNIHSDILSSKKRLSNRNTSLLKDISIPSNILLLTSIKEFNKNITIQTDNNIDRSTKISINSIEEYINLVFSDIKREVRARLDAEKIEEINTSYIQNNIKIEDYKYDRITLPHEIKSLLDNIDNKIKIDLDIHKMKLDDSISSLKTSSKNNSYISSEEKFTSATKTELEGLLESFYTHVELYQSAIMARGGREFSERLKFGKEIDKIENTKISDRYKTEIKESLFTSMFKGRDSYIENFLNELQKIKTSLFDIQNTLSRIEIENNSEDQYNVNLTERYTNFIKELIPTSDIKSKIILKIIGIINNHQKEYRESVIEERKKVKTKIIKLLLGAGLIGLTIGGVLLLVYGDTIFNSPTFNKIIANDIIKALIVEATLSILSVGFTWIFLKKNKKDDKIISSIPDLIKPKLIESVDSADYDKTTLVDESQPKIRQFINEMWKSVITDRLNTSVEKYKNYHNELFKVSTSLSKIANDYHSASENFLNNMMRFYDNTEENLELLSEHSSKIKNDAIEPSFDLFKEKQREVELFYSELDKLEFT